MKTKIEVFFLNSGFNQRRFHGQFQVFLSKTRNGVITWMVRICTVGWFCTKNTFFSPLLQFANYESVSYILNNLRHFSLGDRLKWTTLGGFSVEPLKYHSLNLQSIWKSCDFSKCYHLDFCFYLHWKSWLFYFLLRNKVPLAYFLSVFESIFEEYKNEKQQVYQKLDWKMAKVCAEKWNASISCRKCRNIDKFQDHQRKLASELEWMINFTSGLDSMRGKIASWCKKEILPNIFAPFVAILWLLISRMSLGEQARAIVVVDIINSKFTKFSLVFQFSISILFFLQILDAIFFSVSFVCFNFPLFISFSTSHGHSPNWIKYKLSAQMIEAFEGYFDDKKKCSKFTFSYQQPNEILE